MESAKKRLYKVGLRVIDSSTNWKTFPLPYSNVPFFINCILKCIIIRNKANNPYFVLEEIKKLEYIIGRKKKSNNISRVIDIDIIDFKGEIHNNCIVLPHPRMHMRKFVLYPMKSISKSWKHPIYKRKLDYFINNLKIKRQKINKL